MIESRLDTRLTVTVGMSFSFTLIQRTLEPKVVPSSENCEQTGVWKELVFH